MDKICTQGVVVYKLGDKNPSTKHTYERIVRVTSPRTTPNITTQNRVLQQGYVRWNASKTIPVQRLERVGLDNSKLLLHHLRRNLKRSQFAPFSFEEEEREKDKQEKDTRSQYNFLAFTQSVRKFRRHPLIHQHAQLEESSTSETVFGTYADIDRGGVSGKIQRRFSEQN